MTVNKRFAQDGGELDACMDQLVQVLVQLLEDKVDPHIPSPIGDLHSDSERAIHVSESEPEN